ncbi:MAG: DUF4267 domain-containing protein [Pseudomonadota bacterium]
MSVAGPRSRNIRTSRVLAILAGVLLFLIGVRFLLVPESAAKTFGLARGAGPAELGAIIGLRDLWLGALAVLLAVLGEWRALSLWFLLGAVVCIGDATIAGGSSGKALAIAFHTGSGIFCFALGLAFWRLGRRQG